MTGTTVHRLTATGVGMLLAAAHFAVLLALLDHCQRDRLEVRVTAPPAAPTLSVSARVPAGLFDRVRVAVDGVPTALASAEVGPGLHRVDWRVRYAGGFARAVGLAQLVGPFQDPDQPRCSARLLVGQRFLDDGVAGPGTVARLARGVIERELRGLEQWPLGRFEKVAGLRMVWMHDFDAYLGIDVVLDFTDGQVPLTIALTPRLADGALQLSARATADVDLDNRVYQWIADLFDADDIASETAEQEIGAALKNAFAPPPPIPLPGGRQLRFEYCRDHPIDIVTGRYAAIPLALRLDGARPDLLPVTLGSVDPAPPVLTDAPLSIEFDLDAINAILYYLWRTGYLDQELHAAHLEDRFNQDSTVAELLSLRVADLSLTLPPTARIADAGPRTFGLTAEARLTLRDGDQVSPARLFGTIGFDFVGGGHADLVARLSLSDLALTCTPGPGLLVPCYADLVAELASHADDLHGELTRLFTDRFNYLVLHRDIATADLAGEAGADWVQARFAIDHAEVHAVKLPPTGLIRVDLYGALHQE